MWAKPDLPVDKRVPATFLFGLKKVLVGWGLNKQCAWVDEDKLTLKAGEELVVTASVAQVEQGASSRGSAASGSKKLLCNWGGTWATWRDLQESAELEELVAKAEEALNRTAEGKKGKGWTKGHS